MKTNLLFINLIVLILVLSSCRNGQKVIIDGYVDNEKITFYFNENTLKEKNIYGAELFFKGDIIDSLTIVGLKSIKNLSLSVNSCSLDTSFRLDKYTLEPLELLVTSKSEESRLNITCVLYY